MNAPVIDRQQLAERWQVHPVSILNWVHKNKIPKPLKLGVLLRWRLVDIERFEAGLYTPPNKRGRQSNVAAAARAAALAE